MLIDEGSREHVRQRSPRYVHGVEPISRFADVMAQPSPALDEASMCIAAALIPGVDVLEELTRLDVLAADCPSPTVEGVLRFLFGGSQPFVGDDVTYADPHNSFLPRVLDRRRGIPITLSVLAIEVARRLGVDLVGVGMPAHFLVGEPSSPTGMPLRWFDCFHGARALDVDDCRALYRRVSGGDERFDPQWLLPTPNRHIVIRMLTNLKASAQRRGDVSMQRTVMRLRVVLPELALTEDDELARLMAPFN